MTPVLGTLGAASLTLGAALTALTVAWLRLMPGRARAVAAATPARLPAVVDTQHPPERGPPAADGGGQKLPRQQLDGDIAGLDLAPVSYLAVLTEGWDLEKVDAMEFEYKAWLQCVRDFPEQRIVPSWDCDRYWHCHILITELYLEQTTRLFGQPLHHYPFAGARGEADAAQHRARFQASRPIVKALVSRVRSTLSPTSTAQGD
jgi:hypothetical protein